MRHRGDLGPHFSSSSSRGLELSPRARDAPLSPQSYFETSDGDMEAMGGAPSAMPLHRSISTPVRRAFASADALKFVSPISADSTAQDISMTSETLRPGGGDFTVTGSRSQDDCGFDVSDASFAVSPLAAREAVDVLTTVPGSGPASARPSASVSATGSARVSSSVTASLNASVGVTASIGTLPGEGLDCGPGTDSTAGPATTDAAAAQGSGSVDVAAVPAGALKDQSPKTTGSLAARLLTRSGAVRVVPSTLALPEDDSAGGDDALLSSLMTPITPVRSAPLVFDAGMTRPRSNSRRTVDSPMSTPSPRSPSLQAVPERRRAPLMAVTTNMPPLPPIAGAPVTTTAVSSMRTAKLADDVLLPMSTRSTRSPSTLLGGSIDDSAESSPQLRSAGPSALRNAKDLSDDDGGGPSEPLALPQQARRSPMPVLPELHVVSGHRHTSDSHDEELSPKPLSSAEEHSQLHDAREQQQQQQQQHQQQEQHAGHGEHRATHERSEDQPVKRSAPSSPQLGPVHLSAVAHVNVLPNGQPATSKQALLLLRPQRLVLEPEVTGSHSGTPSETGVGFESTVEPPTRSRLLERAPLSLTTLESTLISSPPNGTPSSKDAAADPLPQVVTVDAFKYPLRVVYAAGETFKVLLWFRPE